MINSLQTWRFVFALMIFHHHFFSNPQIAQFGYLPVTFFFILSGYVMSIGYEQKVCDVSFSYKAFISKRLIRIVPINLFCLFLALILPIIDDVANHHISFAKFLYAVPDTLLIQSWIPIKSIYFSNNSVAWFLSSMFFCYLVFPYLLRSIRGRYGWMIMALSLIVYFSIISFLEGKWIHALVYVSPFFRVLDFMIGIMLYFCIKGKYNEQHEPFKATLLELFAIAVVVLSLLLFSQIPERYSSAALYWIPSLSLISMFTISERLGGAISRLFSKSWLVYLGVLSFPFYMMHLVVIRWYTRLVDDDLSYFSFWGAILCILFTLVVAYLYVSYIEPWIVRNFIKRHG